MPRLIARGVIARHLLTLLATALSSSFIRADSSDLLAPVLVDSSSSHLAVAWSQPHSTPSVAAFELLVGTSSVYTGADTSYNVENLTPDTCYSITLRGLITGVGWSSAGSPLLAATLALDTPDVGGIEARAAALRAHLLAAALAEASLNPCGLNGYLNPQYVDGSVDAVMFRGSTDRTSAVGALAAASNCELAECSPHLDATKPWGPPMQGALLVAASDAWQRGQPVKFVKRLLVLPPGKPALAYSDPNIASLRATLPLLGCRAGARVWKRAPLTGGSGGADALGNAAPNEHCFALNCTPSLSQLLFCAPPAAPGVSVDSISGANTADSLAVIASWVSAINWASHGYTPPTRYESLLKVGLTSTPLDNERRPRERGVFENAVYREAWVHSYLATLSSTAAAPGFPQLQDVFRCTTLPDRYAEAPAGAGNGGASGVLPPSALGSGAVIAGKALQLDSASGGSPGGAQWGVIVTDSAQGSVQTLLESYREAVLPAVMLRGLLLQLIVNLGVARHAFGFHHNGLLALRNIRLQQVPQGSPSYRQHYCFSINQAAMYGIPLAVRKAGAQAQSVSGRGSAGDVDFLFATDPQSTNACQRQSQPQVPKQDASPITTHAAIDPSSRTSWCVPLADVDGLVVKLHDFSASSLTRKQLEWWAAGYSFPNTPWRDDMHDLGVSLCGFFGEKISEFEQHRALADLCANMRRGAYKGNPLLALQHELFSGKDGLPTLESLPPVARKVFVYAPITMPPDAMDGAFPTRSGAAGAPHSQPSTGTGATTGLTSTETGNGPIGGTARASGVRPEDASQTRSTGSLPGIPGSVGGSSNGIGAPRGTESSSVYAYTGSDVTGAHEILSHLRQRTPWISHKDAASVTVQWTAPAPFGPMPTRLPPTFHVTVNGVSVYSGAETSYRFEAPNALLTSCLRIQVTAFYKRLGWTQPSPTLFVNDCNAE